MKYWWLETYQDLEVKMLPQLFADIQYFLVMPKNYMQIYEQICTMDISTLSEQEMCIILYRISVTKNVKDSRVRQIIQRLLLVPDTSLPISDYSINDILEEIFKLGNTRPNVDKLKFNNIAACYSCLNVFYVDQISKVNKRGDCLCPFCGKSKLYFDNDFFPMNYSFLFLSKLFYGISKLGCDYTKLQKLLQKAIVVSSHTISKTENSSVGVTMNEYLQQFQTKKICSNYEPMIIKKFYDFFIEFEKLGKYEVEFQLDWVGTENLFELSYLLVLSCITVLSNFFYIKKIILVINNAPLRSNIKSVLRTLSLKKWKVLS